MSGHYPSLSVDLARQLLAVPLVYDLYRPCKVVLDDGIVQDRVYVVDAGPWFRTWGVWPEQDSGKNSVPIERVVCICDSPTRLPVEFANKLYEAGESGMGYVLFQLRFSDGTVASFGTGNAVDFVNYPEGQSRDTVVDVIPHAGRMDSSRLWGPEYAWCLYHGIDAERTVG